ncbi:MAG: UbiD family decarboxylase, partial [Chloroflexi bacterium]|nr:UbiD family decarboxylase [Chloroflexota bacterium]
MNFREFLSTLQENEQLLIVPQEVDPYLEMAALIHQLDERPVLFQHVKGSYYPVVAGICSQRALLASGLGVPKERLLFVLADSLRNPVLP